MAKLPPVRRIRAENFRPEQQQWIDTLLNPINDFFENAYFALNQNLTVGLNVAGEYRDLLVDPNDGAITLTPGFPRRVKGVWVVRAQENSGAPTPLTNPVWAYWVDLGNGQIRIENISGLTAGNQYFITLLILPETG